MIEGEWYIYFTILEGSLKPVKELVIRMGGDSESMELHVSEEELVSKIRSAFFSSDDFTHLVQENMVIEEEVIFKFGDQANTVSSENWKTIPLEAMASRTNWVAILTDDAEAYFLEINTIVTRMNHPKTCFVIDLHPRANYMHLQEQWDNYVMTDKDSAEVLLYFIHHHLVNPSMTCFTIQDFRDFSILYPFIRATSTEIGKKVPMDSHANSMCYGLCFECSSAHATSYINTFLDEVDKDIAVLWSIQNSADNVIEAIFFHERKF